MGRLDGRVAIISGGAKGMGAAHAARLIDEVAVVVIGDVLDERGEETAGELGPACHFHHLDVTASGDWAGVVDAAQALGPLRVLVNNAAVHWTKPFEEETVDGLRTLYDINLVGSVLGIQAVADAMRAAGGGSVINVSSTAGLTGLSDHLAYASSKWAVRGMTKVAAIELGPDIRVNSVHPGPIKTDMMSNVENTRRFDGYPLARAGEPSEVAGLVAFLASDDSSFQTGTEFVIDGGSLAGLPGRPASRKASS